MIDVATKIPIAAIESTFHGFMCPSFTCRRGLLRPAAGHAPASPQNGGCRPKWGQACGDNPIIRGTGGVVNRLLSQSIAGFHRHWDGPLEQRLVLSLIHIS